MKTTLSTHDIAHSLLQDSYANWSSCAAFALAEYLEEMEASTGEEIELDVVAIRCDFSEYESLQDWATQYYGTDDFWAGMGVDLDGSEDNDELDELIKSHINDNGTLIDFGCGIIVSSF
jgi:hypothetical protein